MPYILSMKMTLYSKELGMKVKSWQQEAWLLKCEGHKSIYVMPTGILLYGDPAGICIGGVVYNSKGLTFECRQQEREKER